MECVCKKLEGSLQRAELAKAEPGSDSRLEVMHTDYFSENPAYSGRGSFVMLLDISFHLVSFFFFCNFLSVSGCLSRCHWMFHLVPFLSPKAMKR